MEATLIPACKPKMIPKIKAKPTFKPKTNEVKVKPTFKPKPKPKPLVKVAPKPIVMNTESDSDTELEPDRNTEFYQRWINGEQLLISMDNKRIYDPDTYEHIGTVCDETIDWNV